MRRNKSLLFLTILLIFAGLYLNSCAVCDDCQVSPSPKQVLVVSKTGTNLIFGSGAVYNPDDIVIKNDLGETVEFFKNSVNQSIDFSYNVKAATYFIALDNTDTDTLRFVFGKDKAIDCCDEFDVTIATSLNGKAVANEDVITIVK